METIDYKAKSGQTFRIKSHATRGDVYEMHAAMLDNTEVLDGKVIKASSSKLFPWLIKRFVTNWTRNGHDDFALFKYEDLENMPADSDEDLIMVLGSYVLNHVKGLAATGADADKKKG